MRRLLPVILVLFCLLLDARTARIWLTPELLATMQAKHDANTPEWIAFKAIADGYRGRVVAAYSNTALCPTAQICWNGGYRGSYQGSGYLEAVFYLSIVYQLTGDTSYSDTAIAVLQAINDSWDGRADCSTYARGTIPISVNAAWTSRTLLPASALAVDWNADRITASDRAATAAMTNCMGQWAAANANDWQGPPQANYAGGHLLGFGLSGIAMDGDDPRMTALQTFTRYWWDGIGNQNSVAQSFASGGYQGGYNAEGYANYGAAHIERLLLYALAVKTYTGVTIWRDYPNRMFRAELYNLMPGRWRTTAEADWIGPGVGFVSGPNFNLYAHLLSGSPDGEFAQYVWNNLAVSPTGINPKTRNGDGSALGVWDDPFVFGDAGRKATDYRAVLPPYSASRSFSDGHVYVRTDWSDSATWASYVGGIFAASGHYFSLAGNVSIARGSDYLLPQIGNWAGLEGHSGSPAIYDSPNASGYRGNTLYFSDAPIVLGSSWTPNYLSVSPSSFGGQMAVNLRGTYAPWAGTPDLVTVKQTPDYTYALSQLTGAYDQQPGKISATNRTLRSYYRTFVWIGDGYFVVKDRAISKAAVAGTYEKLLFWHLSPNTSPAWTDPKVAGSRVTTATVGSSKLVIDTLLPASPVITVRKTDAVPANGGPAIAPVSAGRPDAALFAAVPVKPLTYRVEVRDSNPSDTFQALTVLSALGSEAAAPAVSSISAISATHVGVFVADAMPRIVVLPVDDLAPVTSVSFTQSFSGAGRILVAGITAGTYAVTRDGAFLATVTVGADGTAYFTSTGGGTFSLGGASLPIPPPGPTITCRMEPASGVIGANGSLIIRCQQNAQ